MLLVSVLWALCFPVITSTVRYAPPLELAALRATVAGLALVGYGALTRRPPPPRRLWPAVALVGFTSTGLGFAGMYLAGGDIGPGLATVLANTQPLLAAVAGYFVLGERLGRRHAVGLGLGFAGILVTSAASFGSAGGQTLPRGVAFVMQGAVGVAAGNLVMKRIAVEVDPVPTTGWQLLAGAATLAVAAVLAPGTAGVAWGSWSSRLWVLTALLAIPGTAVAFVLWFWLLRRFSLGRLNAFSYLTPVIGVVIGTTLYGERVGPAEVVGMGLVVAGVATAALAGERVGGRAETGEDWE